MRLSRRLRVEATGDVITPGQHTVLAQLRRGPQTLRELAEGEHVQAPSMTRIVNALSEHSFVTRTDHPDEKRQILVTITSAGEDVFAEASQQRTAWMVRRIELLSEEERIILSQAAQIMQRMSAK
ncbi:MarR family transcriptional regulator [Arthrobacter sp. NA-172]|uniref:MarR family transcriptional regulator n=1 Tax=Arthrobacter sp. NA-172 TaxID=3367524 RepID=UPI00375436B7